MGACEYSNQLSPYLDGELDAGRRTVLEAHLRACADCDAELSELRGLSRLLAVAAGPLLSAKALGRFHNRISELEDDQEQAERTAYRVLRITRILTGIAACLLVAGSLWLVRSRQPAPTAGPVQFAETGPASSTNSPAPWDVAIQPTETPAAPPADSTAPADDTVDWMIGGLVSSAPSGQSVPVGDGDR
jgi:anti-sigma factor RsiW